MPGVAGFRLHTPLNRADIFDELIVFQGASYFRALGKTRFMG
ncbi:glucan biosynthesis protein [Sulfitobacter sp. W074]|nr:glucan biosynthesis protein [Sulfitobacter sp. W074]